MGKPFLPNVPTLPVAEMPARPRWQRRAYLFFVAFVPMVAIMVVTRNALGQVWSIARAMLWGLIAMLGWNLVLRWRIKRALASQGLDWSDLPRLMSERAAQTHITGAPRTSEPSPPTATS